MQPGDEQVDDGRERGSRRAFLTKVGVGAAAAWTAPVLMSSPVSAGPGTPGPAPVFRPNSVATEFNAGAANTLSVPRPQAIANGDLVLAIVAAGAGRSIATPAGWELVTAFQQAGTSDFFGGDGVRAYVFSHVAAPGDSPYSFTKSGDAGGGAMTLAIAAYTGTGTVRVDVAAGQPQTSATGTTKQFPAVTPSGPDRTIVRLGAAGNFIDVFGSQNWTAWPAPNVRVASEGYGDFGGVGSRALTISDGTGATAANGTLDTGGQSVTFSVALINDV